MAVAFAIGEALLGFAAWCTPSWRIMLRILYAPGLLFFSYFWFTHESVRWLASKGKHNAAKRILRNVARTNGKELSEDVLDDLERSLKDSDPEIKESLFHVFRCLPLFFRVINSAFSWISCSFVYYGLTMHSVAITGNPFLNFVAATGIEVPAYFVTYFVLDRVGRKLTLSSSLLMAGIACVAFIFINEGKLKEKNIKFCQRPKKLLSFLFTDDNAVQLMLFLLGKFSVTISYTVLYMYTTEMFPTSLRHSLLAICSMFGRFGAMVAPQVPLLVSTGFFFVKISSKPNYQLTQVFTF